MRAARGGNLFEDSQLFFEGTNTLIVLDDYAASKDFKGRTGQLVNLGFSDRDIGISVWVLTQKLTGITASFRKKRCDYRSFLHPLSQNHKGNIRRLRWRALHGRIQSSDF